MLKPDSVAVQSAQTFMTEPSLSSPRMEISALQGVHCVAHSPLGHGKGDVLTAPAVQQAAEQAGKTAAQVGGASEPWPLAHPCRACLKGSLLSGDFN